MRLRSRALELLQEERDAAVEALARSESVFQEQAQVRGSRGCGGLGEERAPVCRREGVGVEQLLRIYLEWLVESRRLLRALVFAGLPLPWFGCRPRLIISGRLCLLRPLGLALLPLLS